MKLSANNDVPPGRTRRRLGRRLLMAAALAALVAWSALLFGVGVAFFDYVRPSLLNLTGRTTTADMVSALLAAPERYLRAHLSDREVPRLQLDIKFKHLHKLHQKRDQAIAQGLLRTGGDDFVPAQIRIGERTVRVKIRLKGDYADHLEGEKWSFRVHVRKGDQLFGMRRFSLQAPRTRGFQAEPVVLEHFRREGVLAPRYFFVDLSVNGRDIGLMAVEEHFSKELLESQRRREGVILRFHEDPFFENELYNGVHGPYENFNVAEIRPFRSSKIARSEALSAQLTVARGLLRGYLEGGLSAGEVFDLDSMARFMAVAEVWSAQHVIRWHNLRFYFNPITQRLEPIAFDVNMQSSYLGTGLVNLSDSFSTRLLEDRALRSLFIEQLRRIASQMSTGATQRWVREVEEPLLEDLNREFPWRSALDFERLERRAQSLGEIREENFALFSPELVHPRASYPKAIHAYLLEDSSGRYVEFVNVLSVPVEVTSVEISGAGDGPKRSLHLLRPTRLPIRLPATPLGGLPEKLRLYYEVIEPSSKPSGAAEAEREAAAPTGVKGEYRVVGQRIHHGFRARAYSPSLPGNPIPTATRAEALARHPFLRWDGERGLFVSTPGSWPVGGNLVLPPGAGLELTAGTTLRFEREGSLVASGPLLFTGQAAAPVVLEGRSDDELWGGIAALGSREPHRWSHVVVRNTSGIDMQGWKLTGGVTLYRSEVHLSDSRFVGNRTEDALNIVRSRFEMLRVSIEDTPSDAFDADFSDGVISESRFVNIGGDGIDVSGAEVRIEDVELEHIGDKAFSVGERSTAAITRARVHDAGTALASKDASVTTLSDSEFSGIRHVAMMAYVKKPEYGPAQIVAENVTSSEVGREVLSQGGSRILLNGVEIESEDLDIESLYERGYMKK